MKKKNLVLFGILLVLLAGFVLVLSSGLFSQSAVGGQSTQAKCESYVKSVYCIKTSTSPDYACTGCSLHTLPYYVVVGGISTNKVWKADCVKSEGGIPTDSKHTFCGGSYSPPPSVSAPVKLVWCMDSSSLCRDTVQGSSGQVICNDLVRCSNGCVKGTTGTGDYCKEGSTPPVANLCYNKCNGVSEIKCIGSGYVTCQRQTNGCLEWGSSLSYCGRGKECSSGSCVSIPVHNTPPVVPDEPEPVVEPVCDVSSVCTGTYNYETISSDCTVRAKVCASGTKCSGGSCVSIPPVIPNVVNLCSGVICSDSCTASYDFKSGGFCIPETGKCAYANVDTLSEKCLPVPKSNESSVVVPIRPDAEKTWVEKYGFIVLGIIMVTLVSVYIQMSTKGKGKKRR